MKSREGRGRGCGGPGEVEGEGMQERPRAPTESLGPPLLLSSLPAIQQSFAENLLAQAPW